MTLHDELAVIDSDKMRNMIDQVPHDSKDVVKDSSTEKFDDDKLEGSIGQVDSQAAEDKLYDVHGKEKVLETPEDFATALVSLDDDPTLAIYTFRMWFSGVGLAVFGSVLGMLFVSTSK
jgi:hypothetical protein